MSLEPLMYIAFYDLLATLLATYWLFLGNRVGKSPQEVLSIGQWLVRAQLLVGALGHRALTSLKPDLL